MATTTMVISAAIKSMSIRFHADLDDHSQSSDLTPKRAHGHVIGRQ